jgi:hypothetical protein
LKGNCEDHGKTGMNFSRPFQYSGITKSEYDMNTIRFFTRARLLK